MLYWITRKPSPKDEETRERHCPPLSFDANGVSKHLIILMCKINRLRNNNKSE